MLRFKVSYTSSHDQTEDLRRHVWLCMAEAEDEMNTEVGKPTLKADNSGVEEKLLEQSSWGVHLNKRS